MEKVIYKFELPQNGTVTHIGFFDKFLQAQEQNGRIVCWAQMEFLKEEDGKRIPKELKELRRVTFTVVPTGQSYEEMGVGEYFDTVQVDGRGCHIFLIWDN